jgi:hypothetical protein
VTTPGAVTIGLSTTNDAGFTTDGGSVTLTVAGTTPEPEPGVVEPGAPPASDATVPPAPGEPSAAGPTGTGLATTGAHLAPVLLAALVALGTGTGLVLARRRDVPTG